MANLSDLSDLSINTPDINYLAQTMSFVCQIQHFQITVAFSTIPSRKKQNSREIQTTTRPERGLILFFYALSFKNMSDVWE
jgi:hypothetical protein